MPRTRADLVAHIPELEPLTGPELSEYIRLFRVSYARSKRVTGFTLTVFGIAMGIVGFGAFVLIGIPMIFILIEWSLIGGTLTVGAVLAGFVYVLIRHVIIDGSRARVRNYERALRLRVAQSPALCMRCGYGLTGVAPVADRPGIVRCPECGLVNPQPADRDES